MVIQLALGSVLLLFSIAIAGFSYWALDRVLRRMTSWLVRKPHQPKLIVALCIAALWTLAQMTMGVWLWALVLHALQVFATLEEAVYFALVAFTTLGFGDVLLPHDWRLLGGLAAANGMLNIGIVTALMIESLRRIQALQLRIRDTETES